MKVLLVGNYELDGQFSMLGFAACLERLLPSQGIEPIRLAPPARLGRLSAKPALRKWLAYADKYVLFPRQLRAAARRCDLVHILDQGNSIYVSQVASRPHLVTCHDLLAVRAALGEIPSWNVSSTGRKYQDLILKGLRQAKNVACDSTATLEDVLRLTHLEPSQVRLIILGLFQVLPILPPAEVKGRIDQLNITRPFLLHVGADTPYKNRRGLFAIYDRVLNLLGPDGPDLLLVGKPPGNPEDGPRPGSEGRVRFLTNIETETLSALYQSAEALLFPSLLEGFGLPILEAQTLGCPVFTTNRAPMTEVGGDGAVTFDPEKPEEAARIVIEGLRDREGIIERGYANAKRFSPERMAAEYAALYREIAGKPAKEAVDVRH